MKNDTTTAAGSKGTRSFVAVAAISAIVGFAAVYGTLGHRDNGNTQVSEPEKPTSAPAASSSSSAGGKLAGFVVKANPEALADITFNDAQGQPKTLKDFKGKTVLLNLWATWCAPCREEMPSLDRLEKELGSDNFEVVALALERGGAEAARKFLDSIKVENLKLYVDSSTRSGPALRVIGMPTTILINADGLEVGRLPGPAEWDSPDAKRLIEAHLR